jgi:hypothetical protein
MLVIDGLGKNVHRADQEAANKFRFGWAGHGTALLCRSSASAHDRAPPAIVSRPVDLAAPRDPSQVSRSKAAAGCLLESREIIRRRERQRRQTTPFILQVRSGPERRLPARPASEEMTCVAPCMRATTTNRSSSPATSRTGRSGWHGEHMHAALLGQWGATSATRRATWSGQSAKANNPRFFPRTKQTDPIPSIVPCRAVPEFLPLFVTCSGSIFSSRLTRAGLLLP